jgi:putative ATP-dependent endonuclease of the OLD family
MYLSNLKLWNFRKFGSDLEFNPDVPHLNLNFNKGLNVLIGENDSGKSAIIDAIKLVLKTHSPEWITIVSDDFFGATNRLRIECRFDDLADDEAMNFTEWLGMEGESNNAKPYLKVILDANKKVDRVLPFEIRAGVDENGYLLTAGAKDYLKTTFLKPLRDAKTELVPKQSSRLSQILMGHLTFKDKDDTHEIVGIFNKFKAEIENYFIGSSEEGKKLKKVLEVFLNEFFGEEKAAYLTIPGKKLKNILETLKLTLEDERLGLGSHNLLFIAAELLNLEREDWHGLRLGLIEELEAHLHPQAQLRIIEFLQKETSEEGIQLILTTHSPNLASKVKLENLIICHNSNAYPMGSEKCECTALAKDDYKFLERFLDVTKANLFFARGVILVEGWAEELLLPVIADKIHINLTERGVSIINVMSTAFLRYSKIFLRKDGQEINIPVAVVTDLDVKPEEENQAQEGKTKKEAVTENKKKKYTGQKVKTFVSPQWTLEYCLAKSSSLSRTFQGIAKKVHPQIADGDFIVNFSDKLKKRNIDKIEIAYKLAQTLADDSKKDKPEIDINENDDSIKYLLDAIKYAARENTDN